MAFLFAVAVGTIPLPTAHAATTFKFYTRLTPQTWPQIQPYLWPGDLVWGQAKVVPTNLSALTFPTYAILAQTPDSKLANYSAVNLDGEYADPNVAFSEASQIRAFVNAYNGRHPTTPLKWIAFYHLNIIDAQPSIVQYPDIVMFGKSWWITGDILKNAPHYVSLIQQYGRTPGVTLGNYRHDPVTKKVTYYSAAQVLANFHAVIDPAPAGLGLGDVSYFYDFDNAQTLVSALQSLR
jgi:hypothetical protein